MKPIEPTVEDIDELLKYLELEEILMREEELERDRFDDPNEEYAHDGYGRPRSSPYED